jgi:hypothetical protein
MKTVRRTIIIRESDLFKVMGKTIRKRLYNSVDIEPMTYSGIQSENVMAALRNEKVPPYRTLPNLYEQMLWREQNLYNKRYLDWQFTMDYPAGQIYVQSRDKAAREPLHRVTFEWSPD